MDLKDYFKSLREQEAAIVEEFPLIVSRKTADGGKPGTIMEVSRELAAKAIIERRADLVKEPQKTEYRKREAAKQRLAERAEVERRLQVAVISEPSFKRLKSCDTHKRKGKKTR